MRFRFFVPYGRDIAKFWKVWSPYKRDTEWHNERFYGSTSIMLQVSTAAYNTIRVFEQWSTSNPAFADRDATAQVPPAPLSPLLLPTSATP